MNAGTQTIRTIKKDNGTVMTIMPHMNGGGRSLEINFGGRNAGGNGPFLSSLFAPLLSVNITKDGKGTLNIKGENGGLFSPNDLKNEVIPQLKAMGVKELCYGSDDAIGTLYSTNLKAGKGMPIDDFAGRLLTNESVLSRIEGKA